MTEQVVLCFVFVFGMHCAEHDMTEQVVVIGTRQKLQFFVMIKKVGVTRTCSRSLVCKNDVNALRMLIVKNNARKFLERVK